MIKLFEDQKLIPKCLDIIELYPETLIEAMKYLMKKAENDFDDLIYENKIALLTTIKTLLHDYNLERLITNNFLSYFIDILCIENIHTTNLIAVICRKVLDWNEDRILDLIQFNIIDTIEAQLLEYGENNENEDDTKDIFLFVTLSKNIISQL